MITYKLSGLDSFLSEVSQKPEKVKRAVDIELSLSAKRIETGAKENAANKFIKGYSKGTTKNSIFSGKIGNLSYRVVSPTHYSIYLEKGTRKMAAVPFVKPALDKEKPMLMARLRRIVGK